MIQWSYLNDEQLSNENLLEIEPCCAEDDSNESENEEPPWILTKICLRLSKF